jgi:hypothetical protein
MILKNVLILSYLVGLNVQLAGVLCFWGEHDFCYSQWVLVVMYNAY